MPKMFIVDNYSLSQQHSLFQVNMTMTKMLKHALNIQRLSLRQYTYNDMN